MVVLVLIFVIPSPSVSSLHLRSVVLWNLRFLQWCCCCGGELCLQLHNIGLLWHHQIIRQAATWLLRLAWSWLGLGTSHLLLQEWTEHLPEGTPRHTAISRDPFCRWSPCRVHRGCSTWPVADHLSRHILQPLSPSPLSSACTQIAFTSLTCTFFWHG
jgi:hypothetical protein